MLLFRRTDLGLRMRASAFAPEVARLLGVRVGRMFPSGWALAALVGIAGRRARRAVGLRRARPFDAVLVFGFTAAVMGGLDSPAGAVVGGLLLGLALSYVSGYGAPSWSPSARS